MDKPEYQKGKVVKDKEPASQEQEEIKADMGEDAQEQQASESGEEHKSKKDKDSEESSNEDSDDEIKLFMVDFKQCDSKKCTGRKLKRHRLISAIKKTQKFNGIVLR